MTKALFVSFVSFLFWLVCETATTQASLSIKSDAIGVWILDSGFAGGVIGLEMIENMGRQKNRLPPPGGRLSHFSVR